MKNLVVLAGLIAAASTGCIISSGSGSNDAHVGATWRIKSLASNSEIGCPQGYDTAALYNQPIDANGNAVGSPIIDLFDCAAGAGTSAPLPPTSYETWIEITDHTNSGAPYAQSVPAYLDITNVDMTYNTDIYDDGGYFQFAWDLVGASSQQPLTCAQAGVATDGTDKGISSQVFVSGSTTSFSDKFNCEDFQGITAALTAGNYDVLIDAFDPSGPVGSAPTIHSTIGVQNAVTNLGTVTIPITGQ